MLFVLVIQLLLQHLDSYHITGTRLQTLLVYYPYTDVPNETTTYSLTAVDSNLCVSSGEIEIIVDSCVSSINILETRNLEIFPNPTTDMINIELENLDKVDVFNVLGEE